MDGVMTDAVKLESGFVSGLDKKAPRFVANKAALAGLMAAIAAEQEKIRLGGGAKAAEAQRAKGRLTVRERLGLLLDPEPLVGHAVNGNPADSSRSRSSAPRRMTSRKTYRVRRGLIRRGWRIFWSWGCGRRMGCMRSMAGRRGRGW